MIGSHSECTHRADRLNTAPGRERTDQTIAPSVSVRAAAVILGAAAAAQSRCTPADLPGLRDAVPADVRDERLWLQAVEIEWAHRRGSDGRCCLCLPATPYPCWPAELAETGKRAARRSPTAVPRDAHAKVQYYGAALSARRPAPSAALVGAGGHRG